MHPALHAFLSQTAPEGQPQQSFLQNPLILLPIFFLIFYFLMIRPQQKQQKQHQVFLGGLKKGDEVITQGGIIGTIWQVEDRVVTIDVGGGTKLRVIKAHVAGGWKSPEAQQAEAKK